MKVKTTKLGSGSYNVYIGDLYVSLDKLDCGWIARAQWTSNLYTDPLPTKKEAYINALSMILEKIQS